MRVTWARLPAGYLSGRVPWVCFNFPQYKMGGGGRARHGVLSPEVVKCPGDKLPRLEITEVRNQIGDNGTDNTDPLRCL